MFKNKTFLLVILLVVLTLTKLYYINGGFVPAEPDERNYLNLVENLHNNPLPQFDGIPLYHSPPFFHYVGFIFSFFLDGYLAIRAVSLVASLILSLFIFHYLRQKVTFYSAAVMSILFLLFPLVVYYSRLGLIEILITLFAFLFIAGFDLAWEKNSWRWALVSGFALGFGLITKYSILPLISVPGMVFGLYILGQIYKQRSVKFLVAKQFWNKVFLLILVFGSALVIFIPVTYFNYSLNPFEFKSQFKQVFGLSSRKFELPVVIEYLLGWPSYFGWVGIILFVLGLGASLLKIKKTYLILFSLVILTYSLVRIAIFSPRYVVILSPFFLVICSYAFDWLNSSLAKVTARLKLNLKVVSILLVGLMYVSLLPGIELAFRASYHTTFDEVGKFVKEENTQKQWVGSNYWPSAFVDNVGYKISWFSVDQRDTNALSGGGKTRYHPSDIPLFEVINTEGGWVIIEELYSQKFSMGRERKGPAEIVQKGQLPIKVFTDTSPNWPYFDQELNTISVYHLSSK